jgi:hypothetical protein
MSDIIELRSAITGRMDEGASLGQVETELIEPQGHLDDEEKAALWLFAWSLDPSPARGHLAAVTSGR